MNILIADDHGLFREGLRHVLANLDPSADVFEAFDFESTLAATDQIQDIDIVLLDLNLPGADGFSILRELGKRYPALPVVIVSASDSHADIQQALNEGALGFIPKSSTSDIMLNALRLVIAGGIYVPPSYLNYQHLTEEAPQTLSLTTRQLEVLSMIVEGKANKLIANDLGLAESTVKMHVSAIFKCLGVTNRTQAALSAEKLGYC
jgi:DNA-binding NarL/FixJ family response regulator